MMKQSDIIAQAVKLFSALEQMKLDEKVDTLNKLRLELSKYSPSKTEPIEREPCKHEPFYEEYGGGLRSPAMCKNCGVELQATWSEKKL